MASTEATEARRLNLRMHGKYHGVIAVLYEFSLEPVDKILSALRGYFRRKVNR